MLKIHNGLDVTPRLNDQLIKLHSTRSWISRVLSQSVRYFVVCYFQHEIFNTTKLLNHAAPSVFSK